MKNEEDKEFLKAFGQNLKKRRVENNFTQEQLSNDLGIEISQISRIERGILNTSVLNIRKIATILKINIADLFDFE